MKGALRKFLLYDVLGLTVSVWICIFGLLLFAAAAIEGQWDVYIRVGIAVLILDRLFS